LEDAGLVAAGSKARHSQRSKPKLKRNEDNWCTSIEHVRSPLSYTLRNESNKIIIECPVRVLPRRSRCRFRVQWYKDGRAIQFDRPPASARESTRTFACIAADGTWPSLGVQFYHAGNYTCRISSNEIFPPGPGCHGNQQEDPISCYPAKSLKFINLRVSPESHSAIIDSMPYYPPDEPRQLQEGRLYMSRLRDGSEIELHFRDDRQADPFDCRFILGAPARSSVSWRSTGCLVPQPRPRTEHRRPTEFTALGPSSIHGYSIEDPQQVACKPEDFGFAYLSDEWQKSSLMATCYRAGLSALRVSDRSHGYYRPAGASRGLHHRNSSVCLGGRWNWTRVVSPAAASVTLFGEIVKYNKVDHLVAYFCTRRGLESNGSKTASQTVTAWASRDIPSQAGDGDSVTSRSRRLLYLRPLKPKAFEDLRVKYFHLDVIPGLRSREARLSRLSAVADARPSPGSLCYSAAAGSRSLPHHLGALIFIYYFAKAPPQLSIKKRLVCVDNSELYRLQAAPTSASGRTPRPPARLPP
uniref:Ig-like domain-containing protein n=1 Tax=Macrostomum lignano TaxID=282301 RepID=A0A1I8JNS1_9PLAT